MPSRPKRRCTVRPNCPNLLSGKERACVDHVHLLSKVRRIAGTSAYGKHWPTQREQYLYDNPWCVIAGCREAATVADHYPKAFKQLRAEGVANPNAREHLRALCTKHHNQHTAQTTPGGFAAELKTETQAEREYRKWTSVRDDDEPS